MCIKWGHKIEASGKRGIQRAPMMPAGLYRPWHAVKENMETDFCQKEVYGSEIYLWKHFLQNCLQDVQGRHAESCWQRTPSVCCHITTFCKMLLVKGVSQALSQVQILKSKWIKWYVASRLMHSHAILRMRSELYIRNSYYAATACQCYHTYLWHQTCAACPPSISFPSGRNPNKPAPFTSTSSIIFCSLHQTDHVKSWHVPSCCSC